MGTAPGLDGAGHGGLPPPLLGFTDGPSGDSCYWVDVWCEGQTYIGANHPGCSLGQILTYLTWTPATAVSSVRIALPAWPLAQVAPAAQGQVWPEWSHQLGLACAGPRPWASHRFVGLFVNPGSSRTEGWCWEVWPGQEAEWSP